MVGDPSLPETATSHGIKRIYAAWVSVILRRLQMEDSKDLVALFLIIHPLVFFDIKGSVVLPGDILLT